MHLFNDRRNHLFNFYHTGRNVTSCHVNPSPTHFRYKMLTNRPEVPTTERFADLTAMNLATNAKVSSAHSPTQTWPSSPSQKGFFHYRAGVGMLFTPYIKSKNEFRK